MTPKLKLLLTKLTPIVRGEMLNFYEGQSTSGICLETSRCLRVVLRHYGFDPRPCSVFIHVHNSVTTGVLVSNAALPDAELVKLINKSWDNGGWSVGTAAQRTVANPMIDRPNGGYNGHLILEVQDVLVDAAIRQYDRPEHNIFMPDILVTPIPAGFAEGVPAKQMVNGCLVVQHRTGDQQFRRMPGWSKRNGVNSEHEHNVVERKVVNAIIGRCDLHEQETHAVNDGEDGTDNNDLGGEQQSVAV